MTHDANVGIYFWGVLLLGTNLYGLILCFAGFLLPLWLGKRAAAAE